MFNAISHWFSRLAYDIGLNRVHDWDSFWWWFINDTDMWMLVVMVPLAFLWFSLMLKSFAGNKN
jgi:hypothetical protein